MRAPRPVTRTWRRVRTWPTTHVTVGGRAGLLAVGELRDEPRRDGVLAHERLARQDDARAAAAPRLALTDVPSIVKTTSPSAGPGRSTTGRSR